VKHAPLPPLPNQRKLAAALGPYHEALRGPEAAQLAAERPVHQLTPEEEEAAAGFLQVGVDVCVWGGGGRFCVCGGGGG
jgi:hypothetical protein